MEEQKHHEELIKGVTEQLKPVFDKSTQGVYVYLDDTHKACNGKLATLLGYRSAKEWAETEAPLADVTEADQPAVISAYEKATEGLVASSMDVTVKNVKTGKLVKTNMIIVPLPFRGHILSLHFFSRI